MTRLLLLLIGLAASPALADDLASSKGMSGFITMERLPVPEDAMLASGRQIWGGTCENCHGGNKLTGAPKITSTKAWAPRIARGFETLTAHAVDGFLGPKYTEMPARGGNADLSDGEVAAAVAFMVWASGEQDLAQDWARTLPELELNNE